MKSPPKRTGGRTERPGVAGGSAGAREEELSSLIFMGALQAASSCVEAEVSHGGAGGRPSQQGWVGELDLGGDGVEVRRYLPVILPAAADGELDHVSRLRRSTNRNPPPDASLDFTKAGSRQQMAGGATGPAGDGGNDLGGEGVRVFCASGMHGARESESSGHTRSQAKEPY